MKMKSDDAIDICGCCNLSAAGKARLNLPGQPSIRYRLDTHPGFLRKMLAAVPKADVSDGTDPVYPLRSLSTGFTDDMAVALLDSWAVVADVLAFYQERIANEGFLRTATERLSVLEMARSLGYELKPGVAASTYLSFSLEDEFDDVAIPKGTQVMNVPVGDKMPVTFETVEEILARREWNNILPSLYKDQSVGKGCAEILLKGIDSRLTPGDHILLQHDAWQVRRLVAVEEASKKNSHNLTLDEPLFDGTTRVPVHTPSMNCVAVVSEIAGDEDKIIAISASSENSLKVWCWDEENPESHELMATLKGHTGSVNGVAVTFDGKVAVSASSDRTLKVWDLDVDWGLEVDWSQEIVEMMPPLEGHMDGINGVAVTRIDGPGGEKNVAVSASSDRTLKVWDLETGKMLKTLRGHYDTVNAVAISNPGTSARKVAISASSDRTLKVWDLGTWRLLADLVGHDASVNGVAVTSDGKYAVSASSDRTLKVWDLETYEVLVTLKGHASSVNGVVVNSAGTMAFSSSSDSTVKIWHLDSDWDEDEELLLATLKGHRAGVNGLVLTEAGDKVLSASSDNTLKLWDLESRSVLNTLKGHGGGVNGLSLSSEGRWLVSASSDQKIMLWDLVGEEGPVTFGDGGNGHTDVVNAVSLTPDGKRIVSASSDNTLKVWDRYDTDKSPLLLGGPGGHTGSVDDVAIAPGGRIAVSASSDNTLKVWDLVAGELLATLGGDADGHTDGVNGVAITPDGTLAISASEDATIKVWHIKGRNKFGDIALTLSDSDVGPIKAVAVTPDGRLIVSAKDDGTLSLWSLNTGELLATLDGLGDGHTDLVNDVLVTLDGTRAVTASSDKTVKVWDLEDGRVLTTLRGHGDGVNDVALSLDGRTLVSASSDETIRVWDLYSGDILCTLVDEEIPEVDDYVVLVGHPDQSDLGTWQRRALTSLTVDPWSRTTLLTWDYPLDDGTTQMLLRGIDTGISTCDDLLIIGQVGETAKFWQRRTVDEDVVDLSGGGNEDSITVRKLCLDTPLNDGTSQVLLDFIDVGIPGHAAAVNAVSVTPDGTRAVSASDDKTLKVWDMGGRDVLFTFEGHTGPVNGVAITPDGTRVVSASDDRTLRVWDLNAGDALLTLNGHTGPVNGVAITPDSSKAVSASSDGTIKVWDLRTGLVLLTFVGHRGAVNGVAVTPNGRWVISASSDKTLKLWDLSRQLWSLGSLGLFGYWGFPGGMGHFPRLGFATGTFVGHEDAVNAVAVHPGGFWAVSASSDKTLKLWPLFGHLWYTHDWFESIWYTHHWTGWAWRTFDTELGHSKAVNDVAFTPDGNWIVSASSDETLKLWTWDGRNVHTFDGVSGKVNGVAVRPDGRWMVGAFDDVFDDDGSKVDLKVWDLESRDLIRTYRGSLPADGNSNGSASGDIKPKASILRTGNLFPTLEGHGDDVNAVAVTSDGTLVVSASSDGTLRVWDLKTRKHLRTLRDDTDAAVNGVVITPDGTLVVSASSDGTLKVWDLASGGLELTINAHLDAAVNGVAVTPDGSRAVSASDDTTLMVWDLDTGVLLHTFTGHTGPVNGVVVTPDGSRAISASSDGTLKVWDLATGNIELNITVNSDYSVNGVAVTPDGSLAVSASSDGTLKVWDLATGDLKLTINAHPGEEVNGVAVTPEGSRVVSASSDDTLKVWDLKTDRDTLYTALRTLRGHKDSVKGVAITPDGVYAVSASADDTLVVWNLKIRMAFQTDPWDLRVVVGVLPDPETETTLVTWSRPLADLEKPYSDYPNPRVFALRVQASLFGSVTPDWRSMPDNILKAQTEEDWDSKPVGFFDDWPDWPGLNVPRTFDGSFAVDLDASYPKVIEGGRLVLTDPDKRRVFMVDKASDATLTGYTLSSKVTRLLPDTTRGLIEYFEVKAEGDQVSEEIPGELRLAFKVKETTVFAQSELLDLARVPLYGVEKLLYYGEIVLDRLVKGLEKGKVLIVSGKRMGAEILGKGLELDCGEGQTRPLAVGDVPKVMKPPTQDGYRLLWTLMDEDGVSGTLKSHPEDVLLVEAAEDDPEVSEMVVLKEVRDHRGLSILVFEEVLNNCYDLTTVKIHANLALSTHGEVVEEVLGSGEGIQVNQSFSLENPDLTYVTAATASGTESTLELRVNGILWQEAPSLFALGVDSQGYVVRLSDEGTASITFGDGIRGARLPTGEENVTAVYRTGIGLDGEVEAGGLTLPLNVPQGVEEVVNPLSAGGSAPPERLDEARQNAPLTVQTMDRIISVKDYENFAVTFAGVEKASAVIIVRGQNRIMHLTVAPPSGLELDRGSELIKNLRDAVEALRDPVDRVRSHVELDSFERRTFSIEAKVLVDPRYRSSDVLEWARARLLDAFSFEKRGLGRSVTAAEVTTVIQGVDGVVAVDLDRLKRDDSAAASPDLLDAEPARLEDDGFHGAELLLLEPGGRGISIEELVL